MKGQIQDKGLTGLRFRLLRPIFLCDTVPFR